jgi:hypothetical protein
MSAQEYRSKGTDAHREHRCSGNDPHSSGKLGKYLGKGGKYHWLRWFFPVAGILSLIWFLIRVLPKPSRATYPCQRVAAPLATGFLIWFAGLVGSTIAYRKARRLFRQSRYVVATICAVASVLVLWWSAGMTGTDPANAAFVPNEPPNSPIGVAKGIHPGRVVWVRDPGAASWDGSTGDWWDDENTDQAVVDFMVSRAIQSLTGQSSGKEAWDALFRHFNKTKDFGDVGYQRGEAIAIKINMNQDTGSSWGRGSGMPSPHVVHAFLDQLIHVAGVPGSAITIYDASRYIGNPIYYKVHNDPDPELQSVRFVVSPSRARSGRLAASHDSSNPLYTKAGTVYLPTCVTQAKYLINMALMRPHTMFGVTLCAKNHFGSTYFSGQGWTPSPLHNYGGRGKSMNTYNCLVNLNGHRHLAGKTLLYFIDAVYPSVHQGGDVIRWQSFGNDWFSSVLASQDPVAIDSVALDFLRNEPTSTNVTGNPENYMHEMALADNPPSGTNYDPENDGTPLASLGVHEHWNNAVDRQYSRNLGTGDGIELFVPRMTSPDGPIENVTTAEKYDYIRLAVNDAVEGDEIVVGPGVYHESIDFGGKSITVRSTDPCDPAVVAGTAINGSLRAVVFSGGEDANCVFAGFTITDADSAIYCTEASPTIANCRLVSNADAGITLWENCNPTITNCFIADNAGAGIQMEAPHGGRFVYFNYATIVNSIIAGNQNSGISGDMPTVRNCTIVGNRQHGISARDSTVTNSIIYYNGPDGALPQIDGFSATVTYSDVQDSWPGDGNIDADPSFVESGYWTDPGDPDATWVHGDYHLRWDSPCADAGDPDFVATLAETDIDGEPRIIAGRIDMGYDELGLRQADLTRDGVIDLGDVAVFVRAWLTGPGQDNWYVLSDLLADEHIDAADWAELAKDWLWQAHWYQ